MVALRVAGRQSLRCRVRARADCAFSQAVATPNAASMHGAIASKGIGRGSMMATASLDHSSHTSGPGHARLTTSGATTHRLIWPNSGWALALAAVQLAACHSAERSPPSAPAAATPTAVVSVPSVPATAEPAPPQPAPAPDSDTAESASSAEEVQSLDLVDPEPSRPLPKVPYFIEVRGGDIDALSVRGCGRSKVPSAVYGDNPRQLILCADGVADSDPNLTLGSPSLHRVGSSDYGHSEFAFNGEYFEARLQLTVVITKYGAVGQTVEGSYITAVRNLDGSVTRTFFGRFRVLHEPDDPSVHFP